MNECFQKLNTKDWKFPREAILKTGVQQDLNSERQLHPPIDHTAARTVKLANLTSGIG